MAAFAELITCTNFSFLRGASHPHEMVQRAAKLGLAAIGIAGSVAGIRYWIRTPKGGRTWDILKLKAPLLGPTLLKMELARFARTLGTLLASSVPLIGGVRIVQDIASNTIVAEGISKIADGAKRGEGV